ncbi:RhoGEF domain protein [Dictyocaulus viviparus]|uniref:RhoGEF domain protein n=1 Tax=Dictyocaulus viviparus TaxID=29172 RepID=A0A0D8XI95_DICVI|nr:RhoGEF domain protein [Dictyocaulus viviparus]
MQQVGQDDSDFCGEDTLTEIEELQDAAKSIQSLQRVLKRPQHSTDRGAFSYVMLSVFSDADESTSVVVDPSADGRVSGISTRLGHPRGVMQFLPSMGNDLFMSPTNTYRGRASLSRKTSAPDAFVSLSVLSESELNPITSRNRRRGVVDDFLETSLEQKNSESLAGVSRFSKLLRSFRSDQNPSETHSTISWRPYGFSESAGEECRMEDSLLQADILLWKKRSHASLRKHYSVRNLAARELYDTEKSFVEGLEFLVTANRFRVQKYMRPLRQPLECTLIEPGLADKIFYKVPEVLAHHQVLLAALSSRIEEWNKESVIGDVLLSHVSIRYHICRIIQFFSYFFLQSSLRSVPYPFDLLINFSKQSMVDTYISFVDNFKYAKAAIAQARGKPSFEKYYNRCCRDHRNKLDLDSLLISPIQRVPRYELLVKQLIKHTPTEHADHEVLLRAQRHIHNLALTKIQEKELYNIKTMSHSNLIRGSKYSVEVSKNFVIKVAINQHKEANEQMEQRLREIEAIVDGLDDLVSTGRNLVRYDMVQMRCRGDEKRQRCVFTLSDQLVLTSVRRKNPTRNTKLITQSADFLDSNRFKLIIKISLDDVEIAKDTLSILQDAEQTIDVVREDQKVIRKVIELANLIKGSKEKLLTILDEMSSENNRRLRLLNDQMLSNPDLTTVQLAIATANGVETVPLEFGSAEKRAIWETAFRESKNALINQQISAPPAQLKSVIVHQTRPGLQLCAGTIVPGKRSDSAPYIWLCASDKFSGQVAVLSLENGDPCIESCAGIGNAAVTATCTVPPPPSTKRKRKVRSQKSLEVFSRNETLFDRISSGESSESDDDTSTGQITVWIGNGDGEVFVVNSTERIRTRARERVARLSDPVTAITNAAGYVYVATASPSSVQLLRFHTTAERLWDLDAPIHIGHSLTRPILAMCQVGKRLLLVSGHQIHAMDTEGSGWEKPVDIVASTDFLQLMTSSGSVIFCCGRRSTNVYVVNAFSLKVFNHFGISACVRTHLAGRDDIIREHKMGCLRISCITAATSQLWIGTSAGFVISTPLHCAKTQPNPPLSDFFSIPVREMGHSGPCRVLIPINISLNRKAKRMSLNVPSQQASQVKLSLFLSERELRCFLMIFSYTKLLVASCGDGLDDLNGNQDPTNDAVNHVIFWKCPQLCDTS